MYVKIFLGSRNNIIIISLMNCLLQGLIRLVDLDLRIAILIHLVAKIRIVVLLQMSLVCGIDVLQVLLFNFVS